MMKFAFTGWGVGVMLLGVAGALLNGPEMLAAEGPGEAAVYEGPESGIDPAKAPELWKVGGQVIKRVAGVEAGYAGYEATEEEKKVGAVIYRRLEPRLCGYTAKPAPWEVLSAANGWTISTFGTPGEVVDVWVSVYALKDLKGVDVEYLGIAGRGMKGGATKADDGGPTEGMRAGKGWPGVRWPVSRYVLKDWVQLRSLYSTSTFYVTPEVLEPLEPQKPLEAEGKGALGVTIPKGESRTFWLSIEIPKEAKAGVAKHTVQVKWDGGESGSFEIPVRVMPFALDEPREKYWGLYTTSGVRWGKMSDAALKAELLDYKQAGINCVVVDMFGQTGAGFKVVDGKVTGFSAPELERFQKLRREVGLKGPLVLYFGPRLELSLVGARGEKPTGFFDVLPQMKDEVFNGQFRALIGEFDGVMKRTGGEAGYQEWYYAGIDEPGVSLGRQERAMWEFTQARAAGARTWTTLHGEFGATVAPMTSVPVFHRGWSVQNQQLVNDRKAETAKFKQPFWVYGSGAYENQEGNTIQNRHHNGVMMYKLGLDGMVSWTYQWPGADTTSDFVSEKKKAPGKQAMMTYTRADGVVMPTLQWVGTRMGITDYRYLATLDRLITEAEGSRDEAVKRAGAQARNLLEERMGLVPWADPMPESFDMNAFGDADAQAIRWWAAQKIEEMSGLLKKEGER
jgi:hypothetical protein